MASSTRPRLVENTFRLSLTGTPGTGKTTVAALLAKAGFGIISIEELAESAGSHTSQRVASYPMLRPRVNPYPCDCM